ncbi:MAG TPA: DUF1993 domain-containing protein [Steroidobacteraceae bacterium]|nr:DUF1993 domain-containing protein [Steroidobacteraceae bacterium]
MSLSIYEVAIPTMLHALSNLSAVLDKGSAHCEKEKIDPTVLLSARLYPDMFALTRQVQIASDQAKGGAARLAAIEPPKFPDQEGSFAELKDRLVKTAEFVKGIDKARFDGAAERAVELKLTQRTLSFPSGWNYLLGFVFPNLYFHSATAYDILRHSGVKLGKSDFLGAVGQA